MRLGVILTHPVQYVSPWLANLEKRIDLTVFYALRETTEDQARAGFGVKFDWDVPLLEGYPHRFLDNAARDPGLHHFSGCDVPAIEQVIALGRFDAFLVHGWNRKCYWQAILAARRHKVPVLIRTDTQLETPRHWSLRAAKLLAYRAILPRLGDYVYPGESARRYLRHYGVPEGRMHHLPHMVDYVRISASATRARTSGECDRIRREVGVDNAATVFLFVGKLIPIKRPDHLLRSLHQFISSRRGNAPPVQLWIVGDGPMRAQLEFYALEQGLPVKFFGFVNQAKLPSIYAAADWLVLSSISETWGLVVNEAFAAGLPAIVSGGVGCASAMIEEGRTGWVYHGGDDALARTLAKAEANVSSISAEAIDRVNALHSFDMGTARMIEIVELVRYGGGTRV